MTASLTGRTLVLNRSWTAISTTSVRSALCLLVRDVARAVCPDTDAPHDFESWADLSEERRSRCARPPAAAEPGPGAADEVQYVRTVRFSLLVPEVVVLRSYNGFPRRGVSFSRHNLYRRDGFTCQYCGAQPGSELLSIDHVIPRSRGGASSWENCVLACIDCNKRKADRSLAESGLALRRAPSRPRAGPAFDLQCGMRRSSWERYVSDRYWNVELRS